MRLKMQAEDNLLSVNDLSDNIGYFTLLFTYVLVTTPES
jgi:hypothetical protein